MNQWPNLPNIHIDLHITENREEFKAIQRIFLNVLFPESESDKMVVRRQICRVKVDI